MAGDYNMNDCWKCDEPLDGYGNYCTQCGSPQKPSMAAHSFNRSANDFKRGIDGLLDLIDGCPEMLAEGLAEMDDHDDISVAEWERRFENSFQWLKAYFYRLLLSHYDISDRELKKFIEEHEDEFETSTPDRGSLPTPTNQMCGCGAPLPENPPSITTRWKEATASNAVCFDCFGEISTKIDASA